VDGVNADRTPPTPDGSNPIDPDVDVVVPVQRRELAGHLGAEARYGLGLALPHHAGAWPWATLLINMSGCVLIGVLMVVITELVEPHRLARPFLGVGVLGGYTTFSTYTVDVLAQGVAGQLAPAVAYFVVTPLVAVFACALGAGSTRLAARWIDRGRGRRPGRA
jgi:CrcB protein